MIYSFDISDGLEQGEIFQNVVFSCENDNEFPAILLTPQCDLILQPNKKIPKAKYIKLAGIIDTSFIFDNILSTLRITKNQREGKEFIDGKIYDDFIFSVRHFLNGTVYPRYFFYLS